MFDIIFNFLDKLLEEPKSEPKPKPETLVVCSKCEGEGYTSGSREQLIEWKIAQNVKRAKEKAENKNDYLKKEEERSRNAVVKPKVTPVSNKVKYAEVDFSPKPSDWVDSQLSALNPKHPKYEQAKKLREVGLEHCSQGFIKNLTKEEESKVKELRKRIQEITSLYSMGTDYKDMRYSEDK